MVTHVTWAGKAVDNGLWEPLNVLLTKFKIILPKYERTNKNKDQDGEKWDFYF